MDLDTKLPVINGGLAETHQSPARKLPQYVAVISANMGSFALGTTLAWTSPVGLPLQEGAAGFPVSLSQVSWFGALMPLGAAMAVIPMGWCIDRLGRKRSMLMLVPPFVLGWALITWATSVEMIYAGRIISGAAGGGFSLTAPVYTAEVAETSIRGVLGSFFQLMLVGGVLFVYVIGSFTSIFWLSFTCMLVPVVFGAVFLFMPETPMYRLQKGRRDLAEKSLRFIRGKHYDIIAELEVIQQAVDQSIRERTSLKAAFTTKAAKTGLFISFGLMASLQLSGINAVLAYTSIIFQPIGSGIAPNDSAMIVGVIQVIATFSSMLIVDRVGRRILLFLSDLIMSLCTLVIGIYFYLKYETETDTRNIGWLPLTATCIFIIMFAIGFGPVPWIMVGEIFPPNIKGFATSMSCLVSWTFAFVVAKFYSDLELAFGTYTIFWIFTAFSALGTVFVFFVVPETKGKSLEEIQRDLGQKVHHTFFNEYY